MSDIGKSIGGVGLVAVGAWLLISDVEGFLGFLLIMVGAAVVWFDD